MCDLPDDIVFSGMSGKFPSCDSIDELWHNLVNGVDMVTENDARWPFGFHGLPRRSGVLKELDKFDAQFFGLNEQQANSSGPASRILTEVCYETICDAGILPATLRKSRTGVFVAVSNEDIDKSQLIDVALNMKCLWPEVGSLYANKVSFLLDLKGPSVDINSACASSLNALSAAVASIRNGECERAIVAGSNLIIDAQLPKWFAATGTLSPSGQVRHLDADAEGYTKAEAVVAVLLQRRSDAKRVYGNLVHVHCGHDGFKEEGICHPGLDGQESLLRAAYEAAGVDPLEVAYVEAHGTATPAGDFVETTALARVLTPGRQGPLLVGSIKSNIGHTEATAGLCSLVKVLLVYAKHVIPRNLHFSKSNPRIDCLLDGSVKAVSTNIESPDGLSAISNFGIGGSGAHLIVRKERKSSHTKINFDIPRIVAFCGRSEDTIKSLTQQLTDGVDHLTEDFLALLDVFSKHDTELMPSRGILIFSDESSHIFSSNASFDAHPVWFVMSGMGGQWSGMARGLSDVPCIKASIDKCAEVLDQFGIDLWDILLSDNECILKQPVPPFVMITAIQVSLIDLMTLLNVSPAGIIGFSMGEIAAAYADGCITLEQAMLTSYWRGKTVEQHKQPPGLMAVVGLSWEQAAARCPPGVFPACHSDRTSVTISGTRESVLNFIEELLAENIFARAVDTNGVAYHHPDLSSLMNPLMSKLELVIACPKERSSKWISTSTTDENLLKTASPQYFANDLVSPVKFHDALQKVPKDALVIEIGPNGLHKKSITNSISKSALYLDLMKRNATGRENMENLFASLGQLYVHGLTPEYKNLYPQFQFPVANGTPSLSSLIKWRHDRSWPVDKFPFSFNKATASDAIYNINLNDSQWSPLEGHTIDGRVLFPATGYLRLVWETLARNVGKSPDEMAVTFENVVFKRATILSRTSETTLIVKLAINCTFSVSNENEALVEGLIREVTELDREELRMLNEVIKAPHPPGQLILNGGDVYKELRIRGYEYSGEFRGLVEASADGARGRVKWTPNWPAFLDSLLHLLAFSISTRQLLVPTAIRKMVIDAQEILNTAKAGEAFKVEYDSMVKVVKTDGVLIANLEVTNIKRNFPSATLEKYSFVEIEHGGEKNSRRHNIGCQKECEFTSEDVLRPLVALISENTTGSFSICNLSDVETAQGAFTKFLQAHAPSRSVVFSQSFANVVDADVVITRASNVETPLTKVARNMKPLAFMLVAEFDGTTWEDNTLMVIARRFIDSSSCWTLFRKRSLAVINTQTNMVYVKSSTHWIAELQHQLETMPEEDRVWLVSLGSPSSGIVGFVNCLRLEPGGHRIRCLFSPDSKICEFEPNDKLLTKLVECDLVMNVIKNGKHGFFCHEQIADEEWKTSNVIATRLSETCSILTSKTVGDLSTLYWSESLRRVDIEADDHVYLEYMALNFNDVLRALGRVHQFRSTGYSFEYSGIDKYGKAVMGISMKVSTILSSSDSALHLDVPENWSLREAATVPVAYLTVLYGLVTRANIQHGESILIQCGAGGVGQAALHVARHFGCKIFTTCGSEEKREFLKKNFGLTDDVIFSSRNSFFASQVLRATSGRGVDLVLNSLSDELLMASMRCLAADGRFVEIGKKDILQNTALGMKCFLENGTFQSVHIDQLWSRLTSQMKETWQQLMTKYIENGVIKPIVSTVFECGHEEDAFRFMSTGKHIGKILIKHDDRLLDVVRTLNFSTSKCYVIIGGLGGFGLELVQWMTERGARKFVIVSRQGIKSPYQRFCVERIKACGVELAVCQNDVSNRGEAQKIIDHAIQHGPLGGIFNLAVVLKDGLFKNLTIENFIEVGKSKAETTKNFDAITREMKLEPDHFVCFSSIACGKGNPGQTNYGYANSVMERICEKRFEDGLAGKAIQWGAIGDVGFVAEHFGDGPLSGTLEHYSRQGIAWCLVELERLLKLDAPVVSCTVLSSGQGSDRQQAVSRTLAEIVAYAIGIVELSRVNKDLPLSNFGIDSLVAVEVSQVLENATGRVFSTSALKKLTFNEIESF